MPTDQSNPYNMDTACTACPALAESRSSIVHGYGDPSAEFMFIGQAPGPEADRTGIPFAGRQAFRDLLVELSFLADSSPDGTATNAFLTYLTRCHHPDRSPTAQERKNCDPFFDAELRAINPEILIPIGQPVLTAVAAEHMTSEPPAIETAHATYLRGRGFGFVPMVGFDALTGTRQQTFVAAIESLRAGDYRQTKGQRRR